MSKISKIYYDAIVDGRKTIEDVPAKWRPEVERLIHENGADVPGVTS